MHFGNLPMSLSVSPKSPWLTPDNSNFPKSKQQTSDFQIIHCHCIEKAIQKTTGIIVLLVAHAVCKQCFEATGYQNLLTRELRKAFHF